MATSATNPYGNPYAPTPWRYPYTTAEPADEFAQNRIGAAGALNQQEQDLTGMQGYYGGMQADATGRLYAPGVGGYSDIMSGADTGYNPTEMSNMLQRDTIGAGMARPDELNNLAYMSPGEQAAQLGTPYLTADTFRTGMGDVYGAQSGGQGNVRSAYGSMYGDTQSNLGNAANFTRGAVGTMGNLYNAAIDPQALGLSSQFTGQYQFTPADEQAMVNAAGRSAGLGAQTANDALARAAAAQGATTPMQIAALQSRNLYTGGISAADAMNNARISAKQLGLNTALTGEQMRLGAAQDVSGRLMSEAQNVGAANLANEQGLGQQNLAYTQAANAAKLAAEQGLSQQAVDTAMYGTSGQTAANQYGEAQSAGRNAALSATNRANLGTALNTRYGQGMGAGQYYGGVYQNAANTRQGLNQQARGFVTGQQAAGQEGQATAAQQRIGLLGTGTGAVNAASQGGFQSRFLPSALSRGLNIGFNAGAGVIKAFGG